MDNNTVTTGNGGKNRRFLTRRNFLFAGIVVAVIVVAGGAGIALRIMQNKQDQAVEQATESTGPSLPKAVSDAQDLRLNGDTAAANKKIDAALNDSSTSKDDKYLLYIQKGSSLNDEKNYTQAADAFAQATALKQTSEAYDMLGDAYAAAGQKDKAIDAYKKAIPLVRATPVQDDDKEAIQNKINQLGGGA